MIFFLALENFYSVDNGIKRQFSAAPRPDLLAHNSMDRIYCTTVLDLYKLEERCLEGHGKTLTRVIPENHIRRMPWFPPELGISNQGEMEREQAMASRPSSHAAAVTRPKTADLRKQIANLHKKKEVRIAVLNGVGAGIGDILVGLAALTIVHRELNHSLGQVTIDVLVGPHCHDTVAPVYSQSPVIHSVYPLPSTLADFREYDAFFDTGGLMHREDVGRLPYVDFFLKIFGVAYWKVEPARKRNRINLNRDVVAELEGEINSLKEGGRKKLLLFHPQASSQLRSIPEGKIADILKQITESSDYRVITVVPLCFQDERIVNLSERSRSFQHLCAIISQMDAVITVDTSIYHIADAFDIPAVALFTTIDPNLRVKYYPFVKGILLEGARETGYFGRHYMRPGEEISPVLRLWDKINITDILRELERLVKTASR